MSEGDLLKDQRGSPAYISPDVLSGMCVVPVSGPQGRCPAGLHRGSFLQQSVSWGRGSTGLGAGAVAVVRTRTVRLCTEYGVMWRGRWGSSPQCWVNDSEIIFVSVNDGHLKDLPEEVTFEL